MAQEDFDDQVRAGRDLHTMRVEVETPASVPFTCKVVGVLVGKLEPETRPGTMVIVIEKLPR